MIRMTISTLIFLLSAAFLLGEELYVPPLLEGTVMEMTMMKGELSLSFGKSPTMGFNGDYLGPTIRVDNGDAFDIRIENRLGEDSTVHWHGLHVPAEFDGGPHQIIGKDRTWNPRFTIDQKAATLWYHPHLMGKTAEHVYKGLAGMFIIEDSYSRNLDIPADYGVNDFPIILQDRRINRDGSFRYSPSMSDYMHGYVGNIVLTNGAINPTLKTDGGTYRFRILNGSNSTIFRIRFSGGRDFTVIASDGGFLPRSLETDSLIISPGERYEILVDLAAGSKTEMLTDLYGGDSHKSLTIETGPSRGEYYDHPSSFSHSPAIADRDRVEKRTFIMETRGMGGFTINGKTMSVDRIDFRLKKNSTEIWTIENRGMGMMNIPHSFHVHDVQFSVLSVNGQRPGPLYSGPKDTVLLWPGDRIEIALRFEDYTGIYMYHCHFLEHEDNGMMGQLLIE